jgi:hypothetical protein
MKRLGREYREMRKKKEESGKIKEKIKLKR